MIVFLVSTIFHERVRLRGTAVLFKLNDENLDPLGEDIYNAVRRQASAALPDSA